MSLPEGIYIPSYERGPLRQGEVLAGLIHAHLDHSRLGDGSTPQVLLQRHPLAIVMSQDCDLDWDFRARENGDSTRLIPNVLFCEVTTAASLRGTSGLNSALWNHIKQNKNERYQFLQCVRPAEDRLSEGLPELGIDFKRYFTVPSQELYWRLSTEVSRRCRLASPYREHLSLRFAHYLSRVGLPEEHFSA